MDFWLHRSFVGIISLALTGICLQGCGEAEKQASKTSESGPGVHQQCSKVGSLGHHMDCGSGVEACGVLTLETGNGRGVYHHRAPVVHGLWPQVSGFGNSECLEPKRKEPPEKVYECYNTQGSTERSIGFERHEWSSHGMCSGCESADDFFAQVCSLAVGPLRIMDAARAADLDLVDTADTLQRAGYCVWQLESNSQIQLSACRRPDGHWVLADATRFTAECGSKGGKSKQAERPSSTTSCVPGKHGPRCTADADCTHVNGCLRCAHSGFCTDQPLPSFLALELQLARTDLLSWADFRVACIAGMVLAGSAMLCWRGSQVQSRSLQARLLMDERQDMGQQTIS
eukprot:TRINITY_DN40985_c0_g1_i1.p1 TRINITY_DN40985_c0_g1~~TRINITY_DN40985_c0_g1_i1.p1  ORF type:complete len:361 (+),score=48.65 TRINITY_DN40985_c0_g1_i1:57-1085(+)